MTSHKTVTFSADDLRPYLDILSLRAVQSTPKQPPLCRVNVEDGAIRLEVVFRQGGAAGIKAPALATDRFKFSISATRVDALKHLNGDITLTASDDNFKYTRAGGGSGSGAVHPAAQVPEIELPPVMHIESAAGLGTLLELCAPFGGGTVKRRGNLITAGDAQRSIAIDIALHAPDWVLARDAVPAVRAYLKTVGGAVSLLANDTKVGLATEHSWIVWPRSVAPEVAPLRPAADKQERLVFDTMSISTSAALVVAEVGEDTWFDLFLEDGEAELGWSSGGESLRSGRMQYAGQSPHRHLRVHGADLGLLFRRPRHDKLSLAIETHDDAVILTSTESAKIDGELATIHRSAVARRV